MRKRFRSFPSPSSPSHQFLLKTGSKIDFKGVTPDLIFSQNHNNNSHFGMGRVDLVGGWVGAWCVSLERAQLQSNESCKPLTKNLIRPEGRGVI